MGNLRISKATTRSELREKRNDNDPSANRNLSITFVAVIN